MLPRINKAVQARKKNMLLPQRCSYCSDGLLHNVAANNDPYKLRIIIESHNCSLWIHKLHCGLLEQFCKFSAVLWFQFCSQSLRLLLKDQQRSTQCWNSSHHHPLPPPAPEPKHHPRHHIEVDGRGLSTAPIGKKTRHWHNRAAFTRDGTANEGGGKKGSGKKGWSRIWEFFLWQ